MIGTKMTEKRLKRGLRWTEAGLLRLARLYPKMANKAKKMGLRKIEFWSEYEDEQLEKFYKTLTYGQLAERLRRTIASVKARIITVSLECKVENWINDESDFLIINHRSMRYQAIAEHLGRTYGSVAEKARKIGITKKCSIACQKGNAPK